MLGHHALSEQPLSTLGGGGAPPPETYPPVPWVFTNLLLRLCWLGGALLFTH